MTKYRAVKTKLDGYTFDSKAEAKRYAELKLLEKAGKITGLVVHPRYDLNVNGVKVGAYEGDFSYLAWDPHEFNQVIEDVKGVKTPVYRLKKKLMMAIYGIEITETRT